MDKIEQQDSVYVNDETIYNKKIKQVDPPGRNIGIDIDHEFLDNIISAGLNSTLDMAKLQSFTQLSQNRETIYQLIDTMSEDPTISAALEIYAEDTTEANEFGRIVWCESENPDIVKFFIVSFFSCVCKKLHKSKGYKCQCLCLYRRKL